MSIKAVSATVVQTALVVAGALEHRYVYELLGLEAVQLIPRRDALRVAGVAEAVRRLLGE